MGCGASHAVVPLQDPPESSVTAPAKAEVGTDAGVCVKPDRSTGKAVGKEAPSAPTPLSGGVRVLQLEEFEQLDLLDERPMSAVFRLRHRRTGLTVAGKRIQKGCEVHRSGDYINEVKMLQKLSKAPYVVRLHGVCDTDTDFWTVLELCAGGRLAVFLEKFPRKADPVALQLCQAVQQLHSKLVVHLDLKPDNVLLSGEGDVRLCDFVTSCELQDARQLMMGKCGTPHFRAPEVEGGGAFNGLKADVYSLGRTLQVVKEELQSARHTLCSEMLEVISHMTNEDPLKRPGIVEVVNFLKGGSASLLKMDWVSLESVRCDELGASKAHVPSMSIMSPLQQSKSKVVCASNYCQRLGACLCHDKVPRSSTLMSPQERRERLRRCNTP
ncbi:unnamed protein product [Durusdinium trenchii]|uniref:Protein kinase domain-containing protein n=1 Tax=Durusdinium trenchii TaxID=1381693 RepID=A0ABP0IR08_9DINO